MLTTVLFDLDGTLLHLDIDAFLERYVKALAPHFADLVPPNLFASELLRWSYAMIENIDPHLTNLEVFWGGFPAAVGVGRPALEPIFARFYAEEFPKLRPPDATAPAARRLVQALVGRGYTPVIATNPLFPRIAIAERLRWADCADFSYAYVTCGEEMHFCKPNLEFFTEVLERLGRTAEECLMVGNDVEEDMVAQKLGFATALVTDCLIDRGQTQLRPNWRGTLADLAEVFVTGREREALFWRG